MRLLSSLPALALAALLAACASPTERGAAPVLAPNANLVAQGIPPVPQSLVSRG